MCNRRFSRARNSRPQIMMPLGRRSGTVPSHNPTNDRHLRNMTRLSYQIAPWQSLKWLIDGSFRVSSKSLIGKAALGRRFRAEAVLDYRARTVSQVLFLHKSLLVSSSGGPEPMPNPRRPSRALIPIPGAAEIHTNWPCDDSHDTRANNLIGRTFVSAHKPPTAALSGIKLSRRTSWLTRSHLPPRSN